MPRVRVRPRPAPGLETPPPSHGGDSGTSGLQIRERRSGGDRRSAGRPAVRKRGTAVIKRPPSRIGFSGRSFTAGRTARRTNPSRWDRRRPGSDRAPSRERRLRLAFAGVADGWKGDGYRGHRTGRARHLRLRAATLAASGTVGRERGRTPPRSRPRIVPIPRTRTRSDPASASAERRSRNTVAGRPPTFPPARTRGEVGTSGID
uniref:DNA binding protein n=1 Tax=Gallid alphaherpesvirus 3 TaxID=35250 RepID=Q82135_9ALPH|nr:nuclear DNA-binding protein - Marek's disease virus [Gallid alphaherpesvirus 2]AAA46121.1 DNA binding protein [Gallid alphaherpesvirus 3]